MRQIRHINRDLIDGTKKITTVRQSPSGFYARQNML